MNVTFNGHPVWNDISVTGSFMQNCWIWNGPLNQGKAVFRENGRILSAPRYLWNQICEPKLESEHHLSWCLRGNLACVSPLHRRYYRNDAEHVECYIGEPRPDGCREWLGLRHEKGYPIIRLGGKKRRAHRVVWELAHGPIPNGLLVCHFCDHPFCCEISHLWVGSARDNFDDMVRKGRAFWQKEAQRNGPLSDG